MKVYTCLLDRKHGKLTLDSWYILECQKIASKWIRLEFKFCFSHDLVFVGRREYILKTLHGAMYNKPYCKYLTMDMQRFNKIINTKGRISRFDRYSYVIIGFRFQIFTKFPKSLYFKKRFSLLIFCWNKLSISSQLNKMLQNYWNYLYVCFYGFYLFVYFLRNLSVLLNIFFHPLKMLPNNQFNYVLICFVYIYKIHQCYLFREGFLQIK